eukprot:gene11884-5211_t
MSDQEFIQQTIDLATKNVKEGGRPFACLIVKDGKVIKAAQNLVAQTNDPTAHAEVVAIRELCTELKTEHLYGTTFYVMAHPCPMCLSAMYYTSPDRTVFITTREDYAQYYVDDRKYMTLLNFYEELVKKVLKFINSGMN